MGKTWTLSEMRYVAKKLKPHPGYASSPESATAPARYADEFKAAVKKLAALHIKE